MINNMQTSEMKTEFKEIEPKMQTRSKGPILRITIDKIYNKPLPDTKNSINDEIESKVNIKTDPDVLNGNARIICVSPESIVESVINTNGQNTPMITASITLKSTFIKKEDLPTDYSYSGKSKQDCHIMKTRLKTQKGRQESKKPGKCKMHLQLRSKAKRKKRIGGTYKKWH